MKATLARLPVIGTAMRMQQRYTDDAADSFAASIGFFGFLSLIPIIAVALSVLGFLVRGDVGLQDRVVQAVGDAVPGLSTVLPEDQLQRVVEGARDNAGSLLSISFVSLLFTGMKVVAGAQRALAVAFRMEVPTGLKARIEQLLALVGLGLLALVGSAVGGSASVDFGDEALALLISVGLTAVSFLVDLGLFLAAYRLLSPDPGEPAWSTLLPGSLLAAAAWTALKLGGASLVAGGGDAGTYGQSLAGAVGLLLLLYLAGRVFMYGAELSALKAGIDPPLLDGVDDDATTRSRAEPRPARDVPPPLVATLRFAGLGIGMGVVGRVLSAMGADDEEDVERARRRQSRRGSSGVTRDRS